MDPFCLSKVQHAGGDVIMLFCHTLGPLVSLYDIFMNVYSTTVHCVFIGKDGKTWNNYEPFSSVQALLNNVFWREKTKVDSSG